MSVWKITLFFVFFWSFSLKSWKQSVLPVSVASADQYLLLLSISTLIRILASDWTQRGCHLCWPIRSVPVLNHFIVSWRRCHVVPPCPLQVLVLDLSSLLLLVGKHSGLPTQSALVFVSNNTSRLNDLKPQEMKGQRQRDRLVKKLVNSLSQTG